MVTQQAKARNWAAVCYPENMIDTWQEDIGDILQLPGEYCIHDSCLEKDGSPRKTHVHIIIVFNNTTTQKRAMEIINQLSADGKRCCSTIESINNIKHMHNYLIHDTQDCKKKKKHQYNPSERIEFNNFDVGSFEQLTLQEKNDMAKELCDIIVQQGFTNFTDFYAYVISNYDNTYFEILKTHSGLFERLTKGNYQKTCCHYNPASEED